MRRSLLLAAAAAGVAAVLAGIAGGAEDPPATTASAAIVRIVIPGQETLTVGSVAGPPSGVADVPFWSYPADGSVVGIGAASSSVSVQLGLAASARGAAEAVAVTLFGGEVRADRVSVGATAAAGPANAAADVSQTGVSGLAVFGQPVAVLAPGQQVELEDWGVLDVLAGSAVTPKGRPRVASASISGLRVRVLVDHGGLPAGSEIAIALGAAEAAETSPGDGAATTTPDVPAGIPARPQTPKPTASRPPKEPGLSRPGPPTQDIVRPVPTGIAVRLSALGYVFPVFGPASFGDSFGASRPNVAGGWHHGEDIVASYGAPILAVADGKLFSVGWNDIGGWRLWLRDRAGNQFYYAHLAAYTTLAVDGAQVKAGDVLGFVGDTGDAEGGVPHLHFEIHPLELLSLGYDGVVAPYPYLLAWRRADDVDFADGRRYLPGGRAAGGVPRAAAVLLEASDISSASGLVPGALDRALTRVGAGGTTLALPGA